MLKFPAIASPAHRLHMTLYMTSFAPWHDLDRCELFTKRLTGSLEHVEELFGYESADFYPHSGPVDTRDAWTAGRVEAPKERYSKCSSWPRSVATSVLWRPRHLQCYIAMQFGGASLLITRCNVDDAGYVDSMVCSTQPME